MNRGRRRGFTYGSLANLKESVRRRLCDLAAVPYVPDPKVEVSRLVPIKYPEISIPSALTRPTNPSGVTQLENKNKETEFQRQVFEIQAIVEYAFHHGGNKQKATTSKHAASSASGNSKYDTTSKSERASAAKLLMKRKEVEFWDTGILGLCSEPDEWFPEELTVGRKRKAPTAVQGSGSAKRAGFEASAELAGSDLDNLPDPALLEFEDATKDDDVPRQPLDTAGDTLDPESGVRNAAEADEDSEDERWNGDPPGQEDDEDGDDYIETYFDNGENDIDDFNLQMNGDTDGDDLDGIYD
ncbi:unnamed protein product [Hymenolepis diminuta]|uniref:DNA-directed RNA polymerase III subunit n=1 Tax=Hymenolepis diminuta TaxID=6216 RepID=A0A564ZBL3_HYMDI|nr:unnamed protein product [Hymenolepis diminuta]